MDGARQNSSRSSNKAAPSKKPEDPPLAQRYRGLYQDDIEDAEGVSDFEPTRAAEDVDNFPETTSASRTPGAGLSRSAGCTRRSLVSSDEPAAVAGGKDDVETVRLERLREKRRWVSVVCGS
jgi:hypothetical protein